MCPQLTMKQVICFSLSFFFTLSLSAQKGVPNEFASIDSKALKLPDSLTRNTIDISRYISGNFNTDKEKTRAIFIWLANNIQYDIENIFAINFYETKENKISKPLKTRKGICENYATLFSDICEKAGIKSYVVEGYTKQNGFTDYIPHTWSAALVEGNWYMFDPTWGSGYVNGGKFFKRINNDYFMAQPANLIKSHMPFDYLWQFLNYPISNQAFYEGKIMQNKSAPFFNYQDSILAFERLDHGEQMLESSYRIEKNGVKNAMIFDRLRHLKMELEIDRQNKSVNLYNDAVADYNDAINHFNVFISYRNKQFTPLTPDSEIQSMMDAVNDDIKKAKLKLARVEYPDAGTTALINQINRSIEEISVQAKEQQEWLTAYFSKSKGKRKSMFYEKKLTWFGIPIN